MDMTKVIGAFRDYAGMPTNQQVSVQHSTHMYIGLLDSYMFRLLTEPSSSGNACCHLVQNLLPSNLLSNNLKIKIYRTIILPVVFGCETWSLTLREERRLRAFENRVLRRIFGSRRDKVTGE